MGPARPPGHGGLPRALDAARAALEAHAGGAPVALLTVLEAPDGSALGPGARLLVRETGAQARDAGDPELAGGAEELARRVLAGEPPLTVEIQVGAGRYRVYAEAQRAPESLVVVGAGHIGLPLARLGALLGFRVTVLDDREEFATAARFPEAAEVIRADFADPFRDVAIGPTSYVVLVTRGHRYDFDCLGRLLGAPRAPRYIGLIGSRRRVRAAFRALLEAGVPREALAAVRAPVGLDIGAETPEEIAVSIAAEIVQVRRLGPDARHASLTAGERVLERLLPEPE
jgi:xanthine dehydrogenase accessory factor